jgi:peptide/nickel transport system permease protein
MVAYIIRRVLSSIAVLFVVSFISFMLIQLVPGDPVHIMLGLNANPAQIDKLTRELWLDRPVIIQYGHWLGNALRGDLGQSVVFYHQDVTGLIAKRLPITLHLSTLAFIFSAVLGTLFGVVCAIKRGSVLDQVISVLANAGTAIPIFWLGILGIYLFGLKLGWLPIQGYTSPADNFLLNTKQIIMPVICLSIMALATITRQTRSSMLEVIQQDYIRTAWSKGLTQQAVVMRHALRNALIPIVTLLGLSIPGLVGGSVLVETVFNIPGMGRLLVSAVIDKDFVIVQASVLLIGIVVSLANLLVDISYGWLDPRTQR